jgi:hypothetical protein
MRIITKIVFGILILQLFSCQVKVLTTDIEKMQLKKDIQFIFEQNFELFPNNDSGIKFIESVDYAESEYWEFNQAGYIIEHGRLISPEDSIFRVKKYSKKYPHNLKQMIHWFSDTDTMNFFENTIIREDTVFKKIYFSDSTLYWSEISIQDKTGRVIEWILERPTAPKVTRNYYANGLVKEEKFTDPNCSFTKITYKYNASNIKTKMTLFEKNGDSSEFKYEYLKTRTAHSLARCRAL